MQTLRSNWALDLSYFFVGMGGGIKSPISDLYGTSFIIKTVRSPDCGYILFLQETFAITEAKSFLTLGHFWYICCKSFVFGFYSIDLAPIS